jgi:hypothetical protein
LVDETDRETLLQSTAPCGDLQREQNLKNLQT